MKANHQSVDSVSVMDYTGERMVPEKADANTFWEHIYRYRFALRYVAGKDVLDIACGEGYGTAALSKAGARSVLGVDICENACEHARRKYGVKTRCGSAEAIPMADRSVDVVVSFETIEHVPDPRKFVAECCRVLRPGGQLVISTPNKDVYSQGGEHNAFHCSEMTERAFLELLQGHFKSTVLYTQQLQSAAWWSLRSLSTPSPGIRHIRGYYRVRSWLPQVDWTQVDDRDRRDPLGLIFAPDGWHRRFVNPYAIRRRWKLTHEQPRYFIAVSAVPLAFL